MQLFSDKKASTIKSTALVSHLLPALLQNMSAKRRQRLITNGHTLVGFPVVYCTQKQPEKEGSVEDGEMSAYGLTPLMIFPLENGTQATADSVGRDQSMIILQRVQVEPKFHLML